MYFFRIKTGKKKQALCFECVREADLQSSDLKVFRVAVLLLKSLKLLKNLKNDVLLVYKKELLHFQKCILKCVENLQARTFIKIDPKGITT